MPTSYFEKPKERHPSGYLDKTVARRLPDHMLRIFCFFITTSIVSGIEVGTPDWFPFPIRVSDSTPSATDLSSLNDKPAGKNGYVTVKGEQLLDGAGKPLRLYGTNFCFGANFPEPEQAVMVASHLAKMGLNIVRLHHMDSPGKDSLIEDNATTKLHAGNLAKLDRLIAELISRGIYVNLNLHVSRTYPGTPEKAPGHSKGLDHFHAPFIEMLKSYARQLLQHVNPHTGRAYKDEPGIAIIEMNNENSLVLNPWWMNDMPEPFHEEIRSLWQQHLQKVYPSTEALQKSWGIHDGSTGPNLIRDGSFGQQASQWTREVNNGAVCTFTALPDGRAGLRWTSTKAGSQPWSIQLHQSGIDFDEKESYRITFRARSAQKAQVDLIAQNSAPPWDNIGLVQHLKLTPEWQDFQFDFSPKSVLSEGKNRIGFSLLNRATSIDLADVRLCTMPKGFLRPEQTFAANNVPLAERGANLNVRRDFFRFLAEHEISHAQEMKAWLRAELGLKQLITHSHLLFGGIAGARREFVASDLVDTHGYWHHPWFPRKSWDMSDWQIQNISQVADKAGGTLAEIAMQRPSGKPYSVSEYDIPAPNDYAAETFPGLAAMASLQGWSAVYHFAFRHGSDFDRDKMGAFFDLPGHTAKQAFVPLAALVFRQGLIPTFTQENILRLTPASIQEIAAKKSGDVWSSWRDAWAEQQQTGALAWQQRVGLDVSDAGLKPSASASHEPHEPVTLDWQPAKARFILESSHALIASGKLAGQKLGKNVVIEVGELPGDGHATFMLVPLDGQPLASSRKLWLAALRRSENPGMKWNESRSSVGDKWGSGPALVLGLKASIQLPSDATWKVTPLTPSGTPKAPLETTSGRFTITPEQESVWWLMSRE
jgi:Cellulase (glycosyl hydrolase family 5)/Carbohydrate binding domain